MNRSVRSPREIRLPVGDGPDPGLGDPEVVDEDPLGQRRADDLGFGVLGKDPRDAAGMVLLPVMGDEIIDPGDVGKVLLELPELRGVGRVKEGRRRAPMDKIGVIACPVGQGDEGIEEPPVPIDRPGPKNALPELFLGHRSRSRGHFLPIL